MANKNSKGGGTQPHYNKIAGEQKRQLERDRSKGSSLPPKPKPKHQKK